MNCQNTENKIENYRREYTLDKVLIPKWLPEACDRCHANFFEIFILKPKVSISPSEDLWLCKSCKEVVLRKNDDESKTMAK
jgi:hypothetical protein